MAECKFTLFDFFNVFSIELKWEAYFIISIQTSRSNAI